eukprot:comp15540_c0_seq1/m.23776 comp15540_c0_seq1/g.23776  ORF comp15540_c0_seq1/g.23776 comp15540_c0_seq1/m.23776 type:complete len:116 (-) comp15540_c0_seq1:520-867(-)
MGWHDYATFGEVPYAMRLALGCTTGVFATISSNPADIVLVRMQIASAGSTVGPNSSSSSTSTATSSKSTANFGYTSGPQGLVKLARTEGFAGLWRGLDMQILRQHSEFRVAASNI